MMLALLQVLDCGICLELTVLKSPRLLLACGLSWDLVYMLVLHSLGYNLASKLIFKIHNAFL
jgi:hypothetical protein